MNPLYSELQWLPRPARVLAGRLKALRSSAGSPGRELQALASYALDLNQFLTRLAKDIEKRRADGVKGNQTLEPLVPFRLAVLSNSTIDMIAPAMVASAARHGIAMEVILPSYDQVAQEALTPDSKVNGYDPDAVLLRPRLSFIPIETIVGGCRRHLQRPCKELLATSSAT